MEKDQRVSEAKIKAAISAIRDRKTPDIAQLRRNAQVLSLRRKLGKQLQPVFAEAGLDVKRINTILTKHQSEMRSIVEKEKSKGVNTLAALNKNLRRGIEHQARALKHLESKPLIITPITLWTAAQIWTTPTGMLVNSDAQAGNNRAEVYFFDKNDAAGFASVSFYFFWQNLSEYLAVLNANSALLLQGSCTAMAFPDWLSGSSSDIQMSAGLRVFVGGGEIGVDAQIGREVYASSGAALFGGAANSDALEFAGGSPYPFFCKNVPVDPGQFALFEVRFRADYTISGGSITLDFKEDKSGAKFIMCPYVGIELLTAPGVAGVAQAAGQEAQAV